MEKMLTIRDVMEVIPLSKTSCVAIVNSIPHINTGGKLLVSRRELESWIRRHTVTGKKPPTPPKMETPEIVIQRRKKFQEEGLPEDGRIPYRKPRKGEGGTPYV